MKRLKPMMATILLTLLCTITAWAGTWEQSDAGYRYRNDDGTCLMNTWLQENGKWYFLGEDGVMAANREVEGYALGVDGAEVSGAATIVSQYPQVVIPSAGAGENSTGAAAPGASASKAAASGTSASKAAASGTSVAETTAAVKTEVTYVLNRNTKKFHKPGCSSVKDMAAKNRVDSGSSREEIIASGYVPCKRCKP